MPRAASRLISLSTNTRGFTLVEMSVVLVVIGLVILIVYPALNALRTGAQRSLTDSNLQSLLRAAAVYVQANGCLPCPTPATTTGAGFGRVRGDANAAAPPCGSCAVPEGIAPFASLGVPESSARDGWGRWVTMRIDPLLAVNFNVVPPTAPCSSADVTNGICAQAGASQKGLCRSGLSPANRVIVETPSGATQAAAIIFVSHGPNGKGAFIASPLAGTNNGARLQVYGPLTCDANHTENCNADGNVLFRNGTTVLGGSNPYDDSMVFLDRNNLVSFLGNGSCQTAW